MSYRANQYAVGVTAACVPERNPIAVTTSPARRGIATEYITPDVRAARPCDEIRPRGNVDLMFACEPFRRYSP